MKKAVIIAAAAVLLIGAAFIFKINKNSGASAETSVAVSLDDNSFSNVEPLSQDGADAAMKIDLENRIAEMLSELDSINSAKVTVSSDNSSVMAVLDISEELSQDETDAVFQLITFYTDGIEKENIFVTDQNSNAICFVSEE